MDNTERIRKSIIYIEENLTEAISVQEIAESVFTSYYHFHRIFQAITGETIGSYVRKRRLTRAADDLIYTEKRIIDIAFDYQFESQEAFSRAFKKYYNRTPLQLRKNPIEWVNKKRDVITEDVLSHLTTVVSIDPEILTIGGMDIIGVGGNTSIMDNRIPGLWQQLWMRVGEITTARLPFTGIGFSEYPEDSSVDNFTEESDYYAVGGLIVDNINNVPPGMVSRHVSGGKYAVFTHKGPVSTIRATYKYIWATWSNTTKFVIDERSIFELYPSDYPGPDSPDGRFEIYIPVK